MPQFSIITVTLNAGESLGRTIESIRSQTNRDFEHIVKDGGSTDGSIEAFAKPCQGYEPRLLRRRDEGIYDAMNQALDLATGQYVVFMNAGDCLYDESTLAHVGRELSGDGGIDLLYGDYYYNPVGMVIRSPRRLGAFTLFRNTLCHQACFINRAVLRRAGLFDTTLRVQADYDMLLRMVIRLEGKARHTPVPLCRALGGGFSAKHASVAAAEARVVRRRYFPRSQGFVFEAIRASTLPSVRNRLTLSTRMLFLRRIYASFTNRFVNR